MAITPWIPTVAKIKNGEDVSAEVVNPILAQHTQREQHLFEKIATITDKSVLIAYDQPLLPSTVGSIAKYKVVYYTREYVGNVAQEGLTLAKTEFAVTVNSSSFTTAASAYTFGLVKDVHLDYDTADVYLMGLVELDVDIDDPTYGLIQTTEIDQAGDFEPGPFFLSRSQPGKITRNPGGISIFIGYALNRRKILFAPNVSEFNQFFTTYKYNLLDRPIGQPVYDTDHWTIINPDLSRVGWVGVADLSPALQLIAPFGAKFFYNLPAQSLIETDTGISQTKQTEQIDLAKALPPNPPNLTFLTVNGIVQSDIQSDAVSGIYKVDDIGIWWFSDADEQQPWAQDLVATSSVTIDYVTNASDLTVVDHGFAAGDKIRLAASVQFPAVVEGDALDSATDYYVTEISGDTFKIARTETGAPIEFTSNGDGVYVSQPYIWKFNSGSEEQRPKTYLQFLKFNPALKESVVTSLNKANPTSSIIKFFKSDLVTESNVGDLYAQMLLDFVDGTPAISSATAIKQLQFNQTTGQIGVINTPVISKLSAGAGVILTPVSGEPGHYVVSSSSNSTSGVVSNIEPDGAELLYSGLHSYINMTVPSVLPSKIIGKILLPYSIPNNDLTFVMLMLATENTLVTKSVEFEFRYSISKPGLVLGSSIGPTTLSFSIPASYTAKSVLKVGNATGAIPLPAFKIPAAQIAGGDCAVNFELYRKLATGTNPLTTPIGIVDIYWRIG